MPPADPPDFDVPNAVLVAITIVDENCCYVEGAVRVIRLEGPIDREWRVDAAGAAKIPPGSYRLTSFEQVCEGSCNVIGAPRNHCEAAFEARAGEPMEAVITFPIPRPCRAEVRPAP
jgi:hypothetical protein